MAERLRLTVACGDYEIVRALKEGAVKADGLDLVIEQMVHAVPTAEVLARERLVGLDITTTPGR